MIHFQKGDVVVYVPARKRKVARDVENGWMLDQMPHKYIVCGDSECLEYPQYPNCRWLYFSEEDVDDQTGYLSLMFELAVARPADDMYDYLMEEAS